LNGDPFKGNQLEAETGRIVHFWLLVVLQVFLDSDCLQDGQSWLAGFVHGLTA